MKLDGWDWALIVVILILLLMWGVSLIFDDGRGDVGGSFSRSDFITSREAPEPETVPDYIE